MPAGFKRDDLFKLRKSIAPMARPDENREDDVAKLQTMLGHSGDLDLRETDGPTGYYGVREMEATQRFQKRNGLEPDGIIRPNGPTFRALAAQLGGGNSTKSEDALEAPKRLLDKRRPSKERLDDIRRASVAPRKHPRATSQLPSPQAHREILDTLIEVKNAFDVHDALPQDASSDEISEARKRADQALEKLSTMVWQGDFKAHDYSNKHHAYAAELADKLGIGLAVATEFGLTQRHLGKEEAVAGGTSKLIRDDWQADAERMLRYRNYYKGIRLHG